MGQKKRVNNNVDYSSVFHQLLIVEQKLYHQLMQCSTCKDGLVKANKTVGQRDQRSNVFILIRSGKSGRL